MARVAVIGLGAMGSRIAQRLILAGHQTTVWNRTASTCNHLVELGAQKADSPRDAARGAEYVLTMVRDDAISRSVWTDSSMGALQGLAAGALVLECSTLSPDWVTALGREVANRGCSFLEAPVVGSRPQADAGQLISLVGGDAGAAAAAKEILGAFCGSVHYIGPLGCAATLKLSINALFAIQIAALSELLPLMRSAGLDVLKGVEILGSTPVMSPAAKGGAGLMLTLKDAPLFPIELVQKDLDYLNGIAASRGRRVPLSHLAGQLYAEANAAGAGNLNITALIRRYETAPPV